MHELDELHKRFKAVDEVASKIIGPFVRRGRETVFEVEKHVLCSLELGIVALTSARKA
jgi:hypothetical protein